MTSDRAKGWERRQWQENPVRLVCPNLPQLVLAACWQAMAGLRCINGEVDFSFYSTYEQPVPRRHRIENQHHDMHGASESPEGWAGGSNKSGFGRVTGEEEMKGYGCPRFVCLPVLLQACTA